MLYAMGYIGLFVLGGLTGLFLATLAIDEHVHDTYFVVAHFHYIMVGGTVLAFLGGLHYWWPKFTGRMYNEAWGRISAILMFVGFNVTFFPQFILGYLGMPRRYHVYPAGVPAPQHHVVGRRHHPGLRLCVPLRLPALLAVVRPARRPTTPGTRRGSSG